MQVGLADEVKTWDSPSACLSHALPRQSAETGPLWFYSSYLPPYTFLSCVSLVTFFPVLR